MSSQNSGLTSYPSGLTSGLVIGGPKVPRDLGKYSWTSFARQRMGGKLNFLPRVIKRFFGSSVLQIVGGVHKPSSPPITSPMRQSSV